jgi:hypothetical protein
MKNRQTERKPLIPLHKKYQLNESGHESVSDMTGQMDFQSSQ